VENRTRSLAFYIVLFGATLSSAAQKKIEACFSILISAVFNVVFCLEFLKCLEAFGILGLSRLKAYNKVFNSFSKLKCLKATGRIAQLTTRIFSANPTTISLNSAIDISSAASR
jgi:hypothetical protein